MTCEFAHEIDRTAGYLHSLFVMNPDGTNQTEFYGNNSQFPAAILHARSVPNSTKVIAIAGAHHIDRRGKLIMMDRNEGTQAGVGVKLLAPTRDYPYRESVGTGGNIVHDTEGEPFQYPYPLDEDNYMVCYSPEGGPGRQIQFDPFPPGPAGRNQDHQRFALRIVDLHAHSSDVGFIRQVNPHPDGSHLARRFLPDSEIAFRSGLLRASGAQRQRRVT